MQDGCQPSATWSCSVSFIMWLDLRPFVHSHRTQEMSSGRHRESIRVSRPLDSWPAMFRLLTVDNIITSSIGQYQGEWYRFFVAVPALRSFSYWPAAQEGRTGCIDLDPLPTKTHKKASPLESIRIPTNVDSITTGWTARISRKITFSSSKKLNLPNRITPHFYVFKGIFTNQIQTLSIWMPQVHYFKNFGRTKLKCWPRPQIYSSPVV